MKYISTDIDRIIEYLKNRKRAELIEISRALEINPVEVEKWAQVLEKEGLIELEHTFTKMYLIWLNVDAREHDTVVVKTGSALTEKIAKIVPKPATPTVKKVEPKKVKKKVEPEIKVPSFDSTNISSISSEIEDKMNNINQTLSEIANLKAERETLNNSEYVTKISKYDAHLQSLDEKLAERELAVMSLKMKMKNIPNVLKSVSVDINDASKNYYDLEKEYKTQIEGLSTLKGEVSDLRKNLQTEVKYSKNAVDVCSSSLSTLDEHIELVTKLRESAMNKIIEANLNIEKERKVIDEMSDILSETNVKVDEMQSLLQDVNSRIGEAKDTFDEISEYESKLIEAEEMLESIERNYSVKLEDIRKLIESSEKEATTLEIELQKSFLANYVKELDNLSKNYSKDIGQIRKKDEELERKIKEAQERLSKILKE